MKTKNLNKKLALNRKKIANLDSTEMKSIQGGNTRIQVCLSCGPNPSSCCSGSCPTHDC